MHHILKIYLGAENSVTAQFLDIKCDHTLQPNVAMSRGYGWRGGCPAADVPDAAVGSVEWFGIFGFIRTAWVKAARRPISPTQS